VAQVIQPLARVTSQCAAGDQQNYSNYLTHPSTPGVLDSLSVRRSEEYSAKFESIQRIKTCVWRWFRGFVKWIVFEVRVLSVFEGIVGGDER